MAECNLNSEIESAGKGNNSESTSSSDEELTTDLHKQVKRRRIKGTSTEREAEKLLANVIDELSKGAGRGEANNLIREFKKDHKLSIKELASLFLIVWPTVAVKKFHNIPLYEAIKRCQVWKLIMSDSGESMTDFQPAEAASFTLKAAQHMLTRAKKHVTDTSTSDFYLIITQSMATILTLEERDVWQQLQNLRRLFMTAEVSYSHQKTPIVLKFYDYDVETPISTEQRQFKLRDALDSDTKIASDGEITVEVFVSGPNGSRYSVPYTRITEGPLTMDSVISVDIDKRGC